MQCNIREMLTTFDFYSVVNSGHKAHLLEVCKSLPDKNYPKVDLPTGSHGNDPAVSNSNNPTVSNSNTPGNPAAAGK